MNFRRNKRSKSRRNSSSNSSYSGTQSESHSESFERKMQTPNDANVNVQNGINNSNPYYANQLKRTETTIEKLESQLRDPNLSKAKIWALKKQIKTEKAKILRAKRKYEYEVRRFEAGL